HQDHLLANTVLVELEAFCYRRLRFDAEEESYSYFHALLIGNILFLFLIHGIANNAENDPLNCPMRLLQNIAPLHAADNSPDSFQRIDWILVQLLLLNINLHLSFRYV